MAPKFRSRITRRQVRARVELAPSSSRGVRGCLSRDRRSSEVVVSPRGSFHHEADIVLSFGGGAMAAGNTCCSVSLGRPSRASGRETTAPTAAAVEVAGTSRGGSETGERHEALAWRVSCARGVGSLPAPERVRGTQPNKAAPTRSRRFSPHHIMLQYTLSTLKVQR